MKSSKNNNLRTVVKIKFCPQASSVNQLYLSLAEKAGFLSSFAEGILKGQWPSKKSFQVEKDVRFNHGSKDDLLTLIKEVGKINPENPGFFKGRLISKDSEGEAYIWCVRDDEEDIKYVSWFYGDWSESEMGEAMLRKHGEDANFYFWGSVPLVRVQLLYAYQEVLFEEKCYTVMITRTGFFPELKGLPEEMRDWLQTGSYEREEDLAEKDHRLAVVQGSVKDHIKGLHNTQMNTLSERSQNEFLKEAYLKEKIIK